VARPPSTKTRKYNISNIWSVHREILRRHFVGQKAAEIAKDLSISKQTVSNTINSPLGKEILEALHQGADRSSEDIQARIKELAPEALDVVEGILTNEGEPSKLRSGLALKVLGLAGYVEPQKIQAQVGVGLISQDDISRMKASVQDAQFEEVSPETALARREA